MKKEHMAVLSYYDGLTDDEIAYAETCHNYTTYSVVASRVNGTLSAARIASTLIIFACHRYSNLKED